MIEKYPPCHEPLKIQSNTFYDKNGRPMDGALQLASYVKRILRILIVWVISTGVCGGCQ